MSGILSQQPLTRQAKLRDLFSFLSLTGPNDPSKASVERNSQLARLKSSNAPLVMAASTVENVGTNRVAGRDLYNGKIDRPRLFGRALTTSEIDMLYRETSPEDVAGNELIATGILPPMSRQPKGRTRLVNRLHGVAINMPNTSRNRPQLDGIYT